jgi:hypothetical protein
MSIGREAIGAEIARRWAIIESMDLGDVEMRLKMAEPEGEGWSDEQVTTAINWYRRFLKLCVKYPDHPHVPNAPIDEVWHRHILDTAAYRENCNGIFGRFLDHYPYFGLRGDQNERDGAFDETNRLYQAEFGEDCITMTTVFASAATKGNTCTKGVSCNSGGSGTGCGQGCKRG